MSYTFTNFVYKVIVDPDYASQTRLVLVNPETGAYLNKYGRGYAPYTDIHLGGQRINNFIGDNPFYQNHTNLILDFREIDLSLWPVQSPNFSPTPQLTFRGSTNFSGYGVPGYYGTGFTGVLGVNAQPAPQTFEMDRISLILPEGWTYNSDIRPSSGTFENWRLDYQVNRAEIESITGVNTWVSITDPDGNYIWFTVSRLNMVGQQIVIPPCFTRGCRILCADGIERPVEDLSIGDEVLTKDNGLQPIRWIGSSRLDADTLSAFPNRRPVRLRAGAVGNARDLSVSPQHRMLVTGDLAKAIAPGQDEVLVPAKALLNDHSITTDHEAREVEYFHILFDRHELIRAEGAWSESFLPGRYMMDAMDRDTVSEIVSIFPELEDQPDAYSTPARPLAKPGKAAIAIRGFHASRD